ncbi:hypothetical protein K2V14_004676 [Vibrio vulnificus]|nr:hypothetical protein [Vibrio vulnificus]EHY1121004.1 hypothetical protein [Vibrio vulnificus]EHY1123622.1 hypothetical protein [Vibrio vulnificus]HAS8556884.1 hypothetical protein [Vibrio vulnificus]HDY8178234.1 hypothetical protein [Vibrio vulnificus]
MELTIYLNDRPYRVCDMGDGECKVVVIHAFHLESLCDWYHQESLSNTRVIIVDISRSWAKSLDELSSNDQALLAADLHLLADVYWLDHFHIDTGALDEQFTHRLKQEFYPRQIH